MYVFLNVFDGLYPCFALLLQPQKDYRLSQLRPSIPSSRPQFSLDPVIPMGIFGIPQPEHTFNPEPEDLLEGLPNYVPGQNFITFPFVYREGSPIGVGILPFYLRFSLSLSQFQLIFASFYGHFCCPMSLFESHVACRNLPSQGLRTSAFKF